MERSRQRNERHPRQGIQGRHLRQGRGRLQPRQQRVLPVLREARLRKERDERHLRRPRLAGRIPVQNDPQNHARRQFRQGDQEARRRPEKLARRRRGHPRRWRGRQRQRLHQSHHQLRRTGVPHPDPRGPRSAAGGGRRGGLPRQIRQPAFHQVDLPRRARGPCRLRPDRRALHVPVRRLRSGPGNQRRRVRADRHAHAAVDQQLDAQQKFRGSVEPLHPHQNRVRRGRRAKQSRRRRRRGPGYGRFARHAELPSRVP